MAIFFHNLLALFAILFRPGLYVRIAEQHGDKGPLEHRAVFAEQWWSAARWTCSGAIVAACALFAFGRLQPTSLDLLKTIAAVSTWFQALATWFALANAADTWDVEKRLDTSLRSFHFKLLFFPGLVLQLFAASW